MTQSNDGSTRLKIGVVSENGSELIRALVANPTVDVVSLCPDNMMATRKTRNHVAVDFANRVLTGGVEFAVFMTATGVQELFAEISHSVDAARFRDSLSDITCIAGSGAAAEELQSRGIEPTVIVDPSASWRELLMGIDRHCSVANQTVALEVSADLHSLSAGFEARGAEVIRIPIFAFATPSKSGPTDQAAAFFQSFEEGKEKHSGKQPIRVVVFETGLDVGLFEHVSSQHGITMAFQRLSDSTVVVATSQSAIELLANHRVLVDLPLRDEDTGMDEILSQIHRAMNDKQKSRVTFSGPSTVAGDSNAPWYDSPFMKAARGEETDVTPVWMMRQAGRYMAEYREVRSKISFLDLCANPALCSEVMCTAVKRLGVDAAIIFSDLLPILVPMGCDLEFVKGDGPVIHNPIREPGDVDRIKRLESNEQLEFVMETVRQTRNDLPADMPLIGFAGAPFTLASYMIEGGSSRHYHNTKRLMYTDQGAWRQLMEHLTHSITIYLNGQIEAGAQCVQLFDSWAGCLGYEDYRMFVLPYVQQIIAGLPSNVPVINFATGNPALLPLLADTRARVVGIDWRIRLDDAWQTVGFDRSVQGNLDPTVLLTTPAEIKAAAKVVLDQAAGRPGHIFNLGHGILPMTPVDNAIALVDAVHELSQR